MSLISCCISVVSRSLMDRISTHRLEMSKSCFFFRRSTSTLLFQPVWKTSFKMEPNSCPSCVCYALIRMRNFSTFYLWFNLSASKSSSISSSLFAACSKEEGSKVAKFFSFPLEKACSTLSKSLFFNVGPFFKERPLSKGMRMSWCEGALLGVILVLKLEVLFIRLLDIAGECWLLACRAD